MLSSYTLEDWSHIATCAGVFFAAISVYWANKAFNLQRKALIRTSFDAQFTQLLANHHTLYQKAIKSHGDTVFKDFSYYFQEISEKTKAKDLDGEKLLKYWNAFIKIRLEGNCADLYNYLKYIYYEVDLVCHQKIFKTREKTRYVRMIQGQMNNDELFCYFINMLEFPIEHATQNSNRRHQSYMNLLKRHNFFLDLYYAEKWEKLFTYIHEDEIKKLIREDKLQKKRD